MRKILILIIFICGKAYSQDIRFSQFFNNYLNLSPALVGSSTSNNQMDESGSVFMSYRNQWSKMNQPFQALSLAVDHNLKGNFGSVGLLINQDQAGTSEYSCFSSNALYAYSIPLNKQQTINAKFGLQLGLQNSSLNYSQLRFEDQIDPMIGVVKETDESLTGQSVWYFNSAVSGYLYTKNVYLGLSIHNLNSPKYSFLTGSENQQLPRRISLFTGFKSVINKDQTLHGDILFMNQGIFNDFTGGLRLNFNGPEVGVYYRRSVFNQSNSNAISFMLGAEINKLKFVYSGDFTVSELSNSLPFSNEFTIKYLFGNTGNNNLQKLKNPIF